MTNITWNKEVRLILADVDETIADVYTDATPQMIQKLVTILKRDIKLFLVTGAGLESVYDRIIDKISFNLRQNLLVAHCSGAEVCGFDYSGNIREPYLSTYDQKMNDGQKFLWRKIIDQLISEFHLKTTSTMPVSQFQGIYGNDSPFVVMKADRGPQITLEFVNGYDLSASQLVHLQKELDFQLSPYHGKFDFRTVVYNRAEELLVAAGMPVHPHLAGVFALDFILEDVSKTSAITTILTNPDLLNQYKLPFDVINRPEYVEIWGDKFGIKGGSDRKMCVAINKKTRAIDFRKESLSEIGNEFNIQIWDGKQELHKGLLEYLAQVA